MKMENGASTHLFTVYIRQLCSMGSPSSAKGWKQALQWLFRGSKVAGGYLNDRSGPLRGIKDHQHLHVAILLLNLWWVFNLVRWRLRIRRQSTTSTHSDITQSLCDAQTPCPQGLFGSAATRRLRCSLPTAADDWSSFFRVTMTKIEHLRRILFESHWLTFHCTLFRVLLILFFSKITIHYLWDVSTTVAIFPSLLFSCLFLKYENG